MILGNNGKIKTKHNQNDEKMIKGIVSKETVVLRRWGSGKQEFGFIKGVDNVN